MNDLALTYNVLLISALIILLFAFALELETAYKDWRLTSKRMLSKRLEHPRTTSVIHSH